jgi:hypothetical protein
MNAFGFTHNSIHGRNIILRKECSLGTPSIVFIDLYRHSRLTREPCLCNADNARWKWPMNPTDRHVGEGPGRMYHFPEFHLFRAYLTSPTISTTSTSDAIKVACQRYRTIMFAAWHIARGSYVQGDPTNELCNKAKVTLKVHKIIEEEVGSCTSSRGDWEEWYVRALLRIADIVWPFKPFPSPFDIYCDHALKGFGYDKRLLAADFGQVETEAAL